ncbi:NUDIX domain-containing protein [Microbacterium sp.]|uniref:NUDIX domain-containing protein n=1 Tax=Microbacterium sp. TaxID=51671 RepID=UPI0039E5713B
MDTARAPLHYSEYDTRLAAYALIVRDERVLLTWFNGSDGGTPCWSLPGGGVEFDESVQDAIVREAYEESGYHVELGRPLTTHVFTRPAAPGRRPFRSVRVLYEARVVGGTLGVVEVDGTTDKAEWFELTDLPDGPFADIVMIALEHR